MPRTAFARKASTICTSNKTVDKVATPVFSKGIHTVPHEGLLVNGRSFLKHLVVVFFVTGVLVQDEEIRAQEAYHEAQVELADDTHLSEVFLQFTTERVER